MHDISRRIRRFLVLLSAGILVNGSLSVASSNPKLESVYGLPHLGRAAERQQQPAEDGTEESARSDAGSFNPRPGQDERFPQDTAERPPLLHETDGL
jgi:hypothetical protein